MLGHVGQRLRADEEERRFDRLRKPLDRPLDRDGDRRARGEKGERGHEPSLGQGGGVHALCELAELAPGLVELGLECSDGSTVGWLDRVPSACHEHRDSVESSLRAQSKLLLEPPALRVTGLDDAPARRLELVGARPRLCLERGVRHRESRCGRDGLEELLVGQERLVVDEHRDLVAAILDRRDLSARAGRRQVDRAPASSTRAPVAGKR